MARILVDTRQREAQRWPPTDPQPAPRQPLPQRTNERCPRHPEVLMVLAGPNHDWNTVRYFCGRCSQAGLPMREVATGVVIAWNPDRGFGFIDNGGPRVFFHVSDLARSFTPYVGMPVTCHVELNNKGLIGRFVRPR
jgi:cold shock CspA family protein